MDMTKKGVNGRAKGAAFERKILANMEEWTGVKWTRTLLSGGGSEKADITVVDGEAPWLVELKNREEFTYHQLFQWKDTAPMCKWITKLRKEQKVMGNKPIMLIAKANRKPTMLIVDHELGVEILENKDVKFQGSLICPDGKVLHYFLWDEVREKVKLKIVQSKTTVKITKKKRVK